MIDGYGRAELQRRLSEDETVTEQGIEVLAGADGPVVLRGQVETPARREAVERRVRELTGADVVNEISIAGHAAPAGPEEVP